MEIVLVITIFLLRWKLGGVITRYWTERKEQAMSFEDELEGQ